MPIKIKGRAGGAVTIAGSSPKDAARMLYKAIARLNVIRSAFESGDAPEGFVAECVTEAINDLVALRKML